MQISKGYVNKFSSEVYKKNIIMKKSFSSGTQE